MLDVNHHLEERLTNRQSTPSYGQTMNTPRYVQDVGTPVTGRTRATTPRPIITPLHNQGYRPGRNTPPKSCADQSGKYFAIIMALRRFVCFTITYFWYCNSVIVVCRSGGREPCCGKEAQNPASESPTFGDVREYVLG